MYVERLPWSNNFDVDKSLAFLFMNADAHTHNQTLRHADKVTYTTIT